MIAFPMIIYPSILELLGFIIPKKEFKTNGSYEPTVTIMIVAHNEEEVIVNKLINTVRLNYPKNKLSVVVAADNCSDNTVCLVNKFINENNDVPIYVYETEYHLGKTNAQNEAYRHIKSDILIMTDANSMFKSNAVKELVAPLYDKEVAYVCGKLVYTNDDNVGDSESTYWNYDLHQRKLESDLQTITAGNGSIYACRTKEYIQIKNIECHDSMMPYLYALSERRCIFNPKAIAYEKTGENNKKEFKRKIRMNRTILDVMFKRIKSLNFIRYKWFSLFYFGHRIARSWIWFFHLLLFIDNLLLALYLKGIWLFLLLFQIGIYILSYLSIKYNFRFKPLRLVGYYNMTILSQMIAALKQLFGLSKSTWENTRESREM